MIRSVKSKYYDKSEDGIELSQFDMSDNPPTLHDCWAWNHIMHYAVVRFFEIWGKGSIPDVFRSVAGKTANIQASISGMIGGTLYNKEKVVDKDENGKFYPRNLKEMYPKIPRLPVDGIHVAKALAYSMREKDNAKR